jgi:hypothetical protein
MRFVPSGLLDRIVPQSYGNVGEISVKLWQKSSPSPTRGKNNGAEGRFCDDQRGQVDVIGDPSHATETERPALQLVSKLHF